jgi:GNAT superfamily N-acetyltransferase
MPSDGLHLHVRRAQPRDAAHVEALYRELVPGDPNICVAPEHLAGLEQDPNNQLLVAELGGTVCGSAFLTLCLDPMYGFQPFAVVENVIVLPAQRARGVGRALLAALEAVARGARCTKVMLLSSVGRSDAHAFFDRLGYDGERKRGFVKYLNRP